MALGEKMDFVQVARGDERSHAILAAALQRGQPVSGHIYGREFVAAYAASGVTDTHEAIDREIADDLLEAESGCSCAADRRRRPGIACREAIKTVTELGASPSASASAPTTAMRTTCSCSGSTGSRAKRSAPG